MVQRGDSVIELIQVTWDMTDSDTREREIKGIIEASVFTGCDKLTIITRSEEGTIEIENRHIDIVPAWKWLLRE